MLAKKTVYFSFILNCYGPTENPTFSTYHVIKQKYEKPIPIGKPISNSSVYILKKDNQWASSTAKSETVTFLSRLKKESMENRSGAM